MIPDWLVPWWTWWSDFTDLFDWDALAVVAGAMGGGWALKTWADSEQGKRRREGAILQMVAQPLGAVTKSLEATLAGIKQGGDMQSAISAWLGTGVIETQLKALDAVPVTSLPTILSVDLISAARASLNGVGTFALVASQAADPIVQQVALEGLIASKRDLILYGWKLEREAKRIAGRLDTYSITGAEDIRIEMEEAERQASKPPLNRLFDRAVERFL